MNRRSRQSMPAHAPRLHVVLVVLTLMASALVARAIDLQLLNTEFYQRQGDARHVRTVPIDVVRGAILDRNGEPLAISTPVDSVWANPQEVLKEPKRIPELAEVLGLSAEELQRKLGQRASRDFVYLRRHVLPEKAAEVTSLDIPGVSLGREYRRFYPAGEAASHVLGITDIDDRGQEGLELAFNDWLSGEPGEKRVVKDRWGRIIEDIELVRESEPGRDLNTSLDRRLQYLAYRELKQAVSRHRAESGSVVVLEVDTGEILAMVNQPAFNPNERSRPRDGSMRNRAVTDVIEPGSVIKPFSLAAALESGRFYPHSKIDTSPGYIQLDTYTIKDHHNYGVLDLTGILTKSSNVGVSKIALSLEPKHLWHMYERFGFGNVTGSGFPGESAGILPMYDRWREADHAAVSYGYGLSTTPLQLAQAYSVIASEGRIRPPTFVHGAQSTDSAVLDPALARQVIQMMETVTAEEGTGTRAALRNYRVAGKTGTSRKIVGDGYADRYIATFAGFAPVSDPQIVVVALINDPDTEAYYGGEVAAPLFRNVMEAALRIMNVAPDDLLESGPQYMAGGGQQ